ncbi:phytoene desaturase family protein [Mycobacteroides salmoniphilum]|uniref:Phytoene desaturase (Neurosporene-forming) n=1 Tax=Mycobacteroides salmoniphilum TaxID=404941 RepID=A0A4R8SAJ9_9MYCO|nr:NAD(P)/FAD-dependent oxidoreductase [Mycobacteroides salmoniphilum]TDZ91477.1 Phytoene desaturase (neurosporene-forming) [Mycobacteroides salmoniphilum]TEA00907.1 Phytoene desaturase (neurosporene-forming) [Mycobacteroides salmoniphilum]
MSNYDAIVIGSGMGGLTAAAYLAASGKRTLVLEAFDVIGGNTHVFHRVGKWEFDVGVHYLGGCGPNGPLPKVYRGLGIGEDRIEFLPMDNAGFDTFFLSDDTTFRAAVGWESYQLGLIKAFPAEAVGIVGVIDVLRRIGEAIDRSGSPASMGGYLKLARNCGTKAHWLMRPVKQLFDAYDISPKLRSLMTAEATAGYGSAPSRTPISIYAGFMHEYYHLGAWFPKGGGQVLSARMAEAAVAHGTEIRTRAKVDKILVRDGRVHGVRLENGEELQAPIVVSNADIKRTYLELIGAQHLRPWTVRRAKNWRMSMAWFVTYIGADIDLRGKMPNVNHIAVPSDHDVDALCAKYIENRQGLSREARLAGMARDMPMLVSINNLKDPFSSHYAPEGQTVFEAMAIAPIDPDFWGLPLDFASEDYRKNPTYLATKDELTKLMVDHTVRMIPEIDGRISWTESSTPHTQVRYTGASGGTPYGLECRVSQFGPFRPGSKTEIKGLFLAGASQSWGPGIIGATLSGLHAAGHAIGRNLAKQVFAGQVIGDPSKLPPLETDWTPAPAAKKLASRTRRAPVAAAVEG